MKRTLSPPHHSLLLLAALGGLAGAPACAAPPDDGEVDRVPLEEKVAGEAAQALGTGSPRFNEVVRKGTHNSYFTARWINEEFGASGAAMPLLDQLLHEHVRSIELDISRDHDLAGQFVVRHSYNHLDPLLAGAVAPLAGLPPPFDPLFAFTVPPLLDDISHKNTQCTHLFDCLQILRKYDYALPSHEATVVHLEFKEMNIFTQARRMFDASHSAADLDATLWEGLGTRLYTPREMLSRPGCQGKTIRQCVKDAGWPTLEELRGRYLVTVHANWGDNYWDWFDYASGDMMTHVAFPMREFFAKDALRLPGDVQAKLRVCPEHDPWIEINAQSLELNNGNPKVADVACEPWYADAIERARESSVFAGVWLDSLDPAKRTELMNEGVVLRSDSAATTASTAAQMEHVNAGFRLITNDQPWAFAGDTGSASLPTDPGNAVFLPSPLGPDPAIREPGQRLYLHLTGLPSPAAYAGATLPMRGSPTIDAWEVQPSTTRGPISPEYAAKLGGPGTPAPNAAVPGEGCLFAATPDHATEVRLCRDTRGEDGAHDDLLRTWLTFTVIRPGQAPQTTRWQLPHGTYGRYRGDLLRLQVTRTSQGGVVTSTVFPMSAGEIGESGVPAWELAALPLDFSADLSLQGIYGTNDVEFVKLTRNGTEVAASMLATPHADRLVDLSTPAFGEPRWKGTKLVLWNQFGSAFTGVHRAVGTRAGQGRHLYTTDLHEARTAGVTAEAEGYFFLARDPGMSGTTALLRARIGPKTLLTTSPDCQLGTEEAARMCAERVGYIATSQLPGTTPLYRLHRDGGNYFNSGDYLYTISSAERSNALAQGYTHELIVGYVWTAGTLDGLPVHAACNTVAPPDFCTPHVFNGSSAHQIDEDYIEPHEAVWYAFQVPSGGIVESYLNIVGPEDVDLALFADPAGWPVSSSNGYSNVELVRASLPPGSWAYLRVKSYASSTGYYRLSLSEPGAERGESSHLWPGSYGYPALQHPARFRVDANEVDYYAVSSWNGIGQITVEFNHAAGDIDVALYSWTGAIVASSTGVTNSETITLPAALDGPHFLKVYGYLGAVNDYSLIVTPR